ncbi:MAG: sigma-54 dependent transcriptional regulator [Acidobacteriota bacterium]
MPESGAFILIVDDDPMFGRIAQALLRAHGHDSVVASDEEQALELAASRSPRAILLDHHLGETLGLDLIAPLRRASGEAPLVLMTACPTVDLAVEAMRAGALDFLPKPLDEARLVTTLTRALEHGDLLERVRDLERRPPLRERFEGLVGGSPQMETVFRAIESVAPTDVGVLITGESGTGKELVARALHARSERSGGPFVALNMGSLPRELVESTLFGHERGAFTGADRRHRGAVEEARGGTLFLDEIREMPIETQPKLLRFLQEQTYRRVGAERDDEADVRIVAATNVDPRRDVEEGRLRADLYYRLNVVPLALPPLRNRDGDVGRLAEHFLRTAATRHEREFSSMEPELVAWLEQRLWPGNVRQLQHLIERLVVLNNGARLTMGMLPADLKEVSEAQPNELREPLSAMAGRPETPCSDEPMTLAEMERQAIESAVASCETMAEAARQLGISEATLYRRMKKYGRDQETAKSAEPVSA